MSINDQRDDQLDILIEDTLEDFLVKVRTQVVDENGRKYFMTDVEILQHFIKQANKLLISHTDHRSK